MSTLANQTPIGRVAAGAIAETRKGKQVVNLRPGASLKVVRPVKAGDDYVNSTVHDFHLFHFTPPAVRTR